MSGNPLLDAALGYAGRGWHVHPLRPGRKTPLLDAWPSKATTDAATIKAWWARSPTANVGVACGPSGLVVVDVDKPESWIKLVGELGYGIESSVISHTPRGGSHLLYKAKGANIRNSAGKLGDGIDVRGDGGYIVAPPSTNGAGGAYSWTDGGAPGEAEIPPFPGAIVALLAGQAEDRPGGGGHGGRRIPEPPGVAQGPQGGQAIPEGRRNAELTSMAGAMRRKGATQESIMAALLSENTARCNPPLSEQEVAAIAASVGRYKPGVTAYHKTDLGNAERLVKQHGENIHYCHAWHKWLIWTGERWLVDDSGQIERLARESVRAMYIQAAALGEASERKALARWAMASESAMRLRAMIQLAESEPGVPVSPEQLDTDPWLLNCQNGALDLRTGKLRPHNRGDLITKMTATAYDPTAQAPRWEQFQSEIAGGDQELISFKRRGLGYSLTGNTTEQCFFILHGNGSNGKTTELTTVQAILGDYALTTPTESLLVRRGGGIPNDIARLRGARFVTAQEATAEKRLAESLVKVLTGGDAVSARFLYAEYFEFTPVLKLWLSTNHKPIIRGTDLAIWRRIRLIPYDETFDGDRCDRHLPEKLAREAQGILAWLVQGCQDWQEQGLGASKAVTTATAAYRSEQDTLGMFFEDYTVEGRRCEVTSRALYTAYLVWGETEGDKALGKAAFGSRLRQRGYRPARDAQGRRSWLGVGLRGDTDGLEAGGKN